MLAEAQTEILCFHTKGAVKSIFLCPAQNTECPVPCLPFPPDIQQGKNAHEKQSFNSSMKFYSKNRKDVSCYNYTNRKKNSQNCY